MPLVRTIRSVWQNPVATTRTSTSFACGSSNSSSSTEKGCSLYRGGDLYVLPVSPFLDLLAYYLTVTLALARDNSPE